MGKHVRTQKILALTIVLSLQLNTLGLASGAGIDPDKRAGKDPGVMQAANGAPVINIRTPNAKGLSHNQYLNLQVDKKGIIFNNSGAQSKTQLAGYITGNPNLGGGHANLILNEVTGMNPTTLNGYLEIAGKRAGLIVANPNGIVADNTGFINTSRATLTTGIPNMNGDSNLSGFNIAGGTIAVQGKGLDATNTNRLDIYANAIKLNAGIWAKDVHGVTGANKIDYGTDAMTAVDTTPQGVSLDVSAVGGMYADKIYLVGTRKGLGVNMEGALQSFQQGITLHNSGKLQWKNSAKTYAKGDMNITTTDDFSNNGIICAGEHNQIVAGGNFENTGHFRSSETSINVSGKFVNEGLIHAEKTNKITIGGDAIVGSKGIISSKQIDLLVTGKLDNAGLIAGEAAFLKAGNSINNLGILEGKANMQVAGDCLHNTGSLVGGTISILADSDIENSGQLNGEKVFIKSKNKLNNTNLITGTNSLNIEAAAVTNTKDATLNGGTTAVKAATLIDNTGLINSTEDTVLRCGTLRNRGTGRIYGGNIAISAALLDNLPEVNVSPVIAARQAMELGVGTLNNKEHSTIMALDNLTIGGSLDKNNKATGAATLINNNSATIEAGKNLTITAQTINNTNEHFATQEKLVKTENVEEYQGSGAIKRYRVGDPRYKFDMDARHWNRHDRPNFDVYLFHDESNHLSTPDGRYESWMKYVYRERTYEDVIIQTDPGKLTGGAAVNIHAHTLTNDKSNITAGTTLKFTGGTLKNIEGIGTRIVKGRGKVHSYWRRHRDGTDTTGHSKKSYRPADRVSTITVQATYVKENLNATTGEYPDDINLGQENGTEDSKGKIDAELSRGNSKYDLKVTNNALFGVRNELRAGPYIETDPAFTNYKQWLSSDYYLKQLNYDPDKMGKRLGDGFYEQKLLKEQVMNLTGGRYLKGYTSDDEQYKALMDNALEFAKANEVKIGVALTPEQQAKLAKDMVWMVEKNVLLPDGNVVKALVPQVYIANDKDKFIGGAAVIAAQDVNVTATNDILNQGTIIAGDVNKLSAKNINNYGGTIKGATVISDAQNDINNIGGRFEATDKLALQAGNDINMVTTTNSSSNAQGSVTNINQVAEATVSGDKGKLSMKAGKDINLQAAAIEATGKDAEVNLGAGRDLNMTTVQVGTENNIVFDKNNYRKDRSQTDVGTNIHSGGDVRLSSGRDTNVTGAYVAADKELSANAGGSINVQAGRNKETVHEHHVHKGESGGGNDQTYTFDDKVDGNFALGSTLSGNTVKLNAGRDVNVSGSDIVGTGNVDIEAKGNINIKASAENLAERHYEQLEESGVFGSGLGFTIGTQTTTDTETGKHVLQSESNVGSVTGNVNLKAGENATVTASNIVAGQDINIEGKKVDIGSADEDSISQYKHEYEMQGLTVSVGGGIVGRAAKVGASLARAREVKDKRLAALYGVKAYQDAQDVVDEENVKNNSFNVNIGYGSSKSTSVTDSHTTVAKGSNIVAEGNVNIKATADDLNIKGSTVTGTDVTLEAKKNVNISASENTNKTNTDKKDTSVGVGVSFSTAGGVGAYLNAFEAKEKIKENGTTYTPSIVAAKDKLNVTSGADTNIKGSQLHGDKVKVNVGGNLNIASQQEKEKYDEKSASAGINIGLDGVGGSASAGKIKSDYASVKDQAGIYAGKKGFEVKVKGNTDLKGAVIDSKADADKNELTTGTLTYKDIENKAEYSASSYGASYDSEATNSKSGKLGDKGLIPQIPVTSSDKASSTTKSGVAPGKINITDKEKQQQDIGPLNRVTDNTLNQLGKIFDKDKVLERQELAALFGEIAFNQVHKLAQKNGWQDGSKEKIALHAFVGGVMAALGNGSVLAGAGGAAVNEAVQKELSKIKDPALHQWASALIGAAAGAAGGDAGTGASTAASGTRFNYLDQDKPGKVLERAEVIIWEATDGEENLAITNPHGAVRYKYSDGTVVEVHFGKYSWKNRTDQDGTILQANSDTYIKSELDNKNARIFSTITDPNKLKIMRDNTNAYMKEAAKEHKGQRIVDEGKVRKDVYDRHKTGPVLVYQGGNGKYSNYNLIFKNCVDFVNDVLQGTGHKKISKEELIAQWRDKMAKKRMEQEMD